MNTYKIIMEHTEEEIQANPSIITSVGRVEEEQDEILMEEGIGSEF